MNVKKINPKSAQLLLKICEINRVPSENIFIEETISKEGIRPIRTVFTKDKLEQKTVSFLIDTKHDIIEELDHIEAISLDEYKKYMLSDDPCFMPKINIYDRET